VSPLSLSAGLNGRLISVISVKDDQRAAERDLHLGMTHPSHVGCNFAVRTGNTHLRGLQVELKKQLIPQSRDHSMRRASRCSENDGVNATIGPKAEL
jgi:hypothetical protein